MCITKVDSSQNFKLELGVTLAQQLRLITEMQTNHTNPEFILNISKENQMRGGGEPSPSPLIHILSHLTVTAHVEKSTNAPAFLYGACA